MAGPLERAWNELVTTDDPILAFSELNYSVEAGSGRRRNKAMQVANANDAMRILGPIFMPYFQASGNPDPMNALVRMWCESMDIDPTPFMLPRPQPQPTMPQGGPPPQMGPQQLPPQIAQLLQQMPPQLAQQLVSGAPAAPQVQPEMMQ